mgnify:CR=1 FL=1
MVRRRCRGAVGLIPAHAGKTQPPIPGSAANPAHPRSRGENITSRAGISLSLGSSPLTRGKLRSAATARMSAGLIPAHAGKTLNDASSELSPAAHPRSRGENKLAPLNADLPLGSSPLTRGKRNTAQSVSERPRLIPAHAGKTTAATGPGGSCTAHPRSRGENIHSTNRVDSWGGSSPLTRGKRLNRGRSHTLLRLIPAHAGKTRP